MLKEKRNSGKPNQGSGRVLSRERFVDLLFEDIDDDYDYNDDIMIMISLSIMIPRVII